ncbi:hypothetical protein llap_21619 [Limosa lapponica baueri]|uniref:Uncharacterized protein n=1 Tax=Limosa lapponica baueri TaxID=1758121 RepID=A0A2I0T2R2_LIMLA|nr:hypothetical protein llap_21619 [Limosa lapponica baueri]
MGRHGMYPVQVTIPPSQLAWGPLVTKMTRQEPVNALGIVLGVGLALLILVLFGYAFVRWYQRGQCWCRPNFVFNLYHTW